MKQELLKGLSEELLAFAKAEGIELSEEQLEAINGGACSTTNNTARQIINPF